MNIFVIATTLQAGGGITIYKQFLSHLPEYVGQNRYWDICQSCIAAGGDRGGDLYFIPIAV